MSPTPAPSPASSPGTAGVDAFSLAEHLGLGALAIVSYAVLGVLLLIIGFYVIDLAIPGKLSKMIKEDRNPNATLLTTSGLAAVGLIVAASIWSAGGALHEGLLVTLVFGLVGIAVQTVGMVAFDKVAGISVRELVQEPELQPGARLLAVTHLAIGLVTAIAVI
ncbi:uncharacterized membrane protein YjfL (UPF0719 family) [Streptosporangium becharense]|uniref:Uncharacterized membrane protein YjfL (UPF0719 family) n=1 Tax=Streptosporangium becharense TaxID=1816182 RepID=A0A7W9ILB5_9ACTN|nr:DUF350 domain-containing protein [Streptosporangium becharense]MBB2913235.1 uncharacterized membrane protein YjfL (UPF0719 family) [Streptosporangium becharense]MBB5822218.1 uncharacterized membrane protein YjfL (UPF0719 family) [Streptosporangium becharense]